MTVRYLVEESEEGDYAIHASKDKNSTILQVLEPFEVVLADSISPEGDVDWIFGSLEQNPMIKGWIQLQGLRGPSDLDRIGIDFRKTGKQQQTSRKVDVQHVSIGHSDCAPWLSVAREEQETWRSEGLREGHGKGLQKVVEYFRSVNLQTNRNQPWCGAFVGFCLQKSGRQFAATIVEDGARAASWIDWGNVDLDPFGEPEIPAGAVVVTKPLAKGASGHVGFFVRRDLASRRLILLGGNQSNSINEKPFHADQIRHIRWIDRAMTISHAKAAIPDDIAIVGITEEDILILARTLYGEARGENRKGIEAVANVILNRLARGFMGKTICEICKKPFQFSCWNQDDPNRALIENLQPGDNPAIDLCFEIANRSVSGNFPDHVGEDTLHYHSASTHLPDWVVSSRNPVVTLREGGHVFYRNID